MDALMPNPIIEFYPNQMAKVRKTFGYEDINRLHQDIKLFEDWIKMQEHFEVKEYDKAYLERYLISSKGSIERAKKRLDKLCTLRGLMPEYLQGYTVNGFEKFLKTSYFCALPKPTPENYRIIFYTMHNPDTTNFEHIHFIRCLLMIFEYLYCHDYNTGIQMVIDTRQFTFGIISKLSPILIANATTIIIDALGLRLRGIHLISGSKLIDTVATIVKQGLTKKLNTRLHVHQDYESMFQHIPKDILPVDIGGDLGTAQEICEKNFKEFTTPEFMYVMKFRESAVTNESQRLRCDFNEEYSGMPGSFKVLSVD